MGLSKIPWVSTRGWGGYERYHGSLAGGGWGYQRYHGSLPGGGGAMKDTMGL